MLLRFSSPTASPDFEGRGGDELAETICRILWSAYAKTSSINLKSLCVIPKEFCYIIDVDILVNKSKLRYFHRYAS